MFFTKANTDFFEYFTLFDQVGDVTTGPNLDWFFLGSGGGFIDETGLLFNECFHLIELFLSVLMLSRG